MRITFEIDANDLKKIQTITGQKKKSPAISHALASFLRLQEKRAFIEKALLERQLRAKGLIVPRNDLFVATIGIRTGVVILCRDSHFSAVQKVAGERLKVEQV